MPIVELSCGRCGEELVANALHVCDELVPLLRVAPASTVRIGASSRGVGRIVVGYRPGDRRVLENRERFGLEPRLVRQCFGGCGYPVYFYSGGVDAVADRDAEVVCTVCRNEHYSELVEAL